MRIPYKGTGTAINELIGGQVQMMVPSAALGAPYVKLGKLRALAVGSARPSALFPGMPTVATSGLPGYEAATVVAIFTTARTRAPIISKLNKEIARVLNRPEVRKRFFGVGSEIIGNSPEQFTAWLKSDIAKWGKLIKDAGIVVE
ncbi:MAG: hypothetical protein HYY79_00170 [Betaproteobacteria bacterium]|nr:hypothetical protein [Betaproteobacteria bacterium]